LSSDLEKQELFGGVTVLVDKGRAADVMYLALSEIFDTVQHNILVLSWRDMDLMDGPFGG